MNDKEYEQFKEYKEMLLQHLSFKGFQKPKVFVIDNVNVKNRLEEVFKYDIQELARYKDVELFTMKDPEIKVFKICTSIEYLKLDEIINVNSNKVDYSNDKTVDAGRNLKILLTKVNSTSINEISASSRAKQVLVEAKSNISSLKTNKNDH